jgi:RHS repeat-associated protein
VGQSSIGADTVPASVNLQVSLANTENEVISRVDYLSGTTVVAQATAAPWSATWNATSAGSYSLTAKVYYSCKSPSKGGTRNSTSAPVTINVASTSVPTVSLAVAANSGIAPAEIQLAATAEDTGNGVDRVEFFVNGSLVGRVTQRPFTFYLSGVAAGTYTFQARAFNYQGGSATSANVSATVNAAPSLPAVPLSETRTSIFDYDTSTGLLIKEVIEPDKSDLCVATDYVYDNWGNRKTTTVRNCNGSTAKVPGGYAETITAAANALPAARTTNVFYDSRGQFPMGRVNALNQTSSEQHDHKTGALTIFGDINGLTTVYMVDPFGRKTAEYRPDGTSSTWTYGWTPAGTPGCTEGYVFPSRNFFPICYGNLRQDFDSTGAAVHPGLWEYFDRMERRLFSSRMALDGSDWIDENALWFDALGRVADEYKPFYRNQWLYETGPMTRRSYDVLGRVTRVREQLQFEVHSEKRISYEGMRTVTTVLPGWEDPQQVTIQETNAAGQTSVVYDAKGGRTRYDYTAFGQLAATDAQGVVSSATYDGRGRKKTSVDPDAGTWQYVYNVAGELIRQTNPRSQTTTLEYDRLGRMTKRSELEMVATWVYDTPNTTHCATPANRAVGQLTQVVTASGYGYNRYLCHDNAGRLNKQVVDIEGNLFTSSIAFDNASRPSVVTYPASASIPGGFQLKHVYNGQGYLTQLLNNANSAPIWQLTGQNPYGVNTGETLGAGGATISRSTDELGRVKQITAGAGGAIQNETYDYNLMGVLRSRAWVVGGVSRTETFVHDELNRLVSVSGASSKTYSYDLQGNLIGKPEVGTYNYTAGTHKLASVTGTVNGVANPSFSYDASGNITAGAGFSATWSSFDMPLTLTKGSTTDTFKYGAEHQRVKQVATPAPGSGSGTLTTFYLSNFEKEVNTATGITEYKHYISAGGRTIAIWVDRSNGTNEWRFLHQDRQGSVVAVTDYNGNVTERMSYDAWGKRRNTDGTDIAVTPIVRTDRGYTGHEMLDNIGLVHMNGRIYDPLLGRFISADPVIDGMLNPQAFNRYSYVLNSPLVLTDPTGLSPWVHLREAGKMVVLYVVGTAACYGNGYCGAALAGAYSGYQQRHDGTGAAIGAVNGLVSHEIGQQFPVFNKEGTFQGMWNLLENASAHAVQGCVNASLQGGNCGRAAAAQFTASVVGPALDEVLGTNNTPWMVLTRGVAGGAGSVAAGGTFEEGFREGVLEGVTNAASELLSSYQIGLQGEDAWDRYMRATGGTVIGRQLYYVVEVDGKVVLDAEGKPMKGIADGLGRTRWGGVEWAEVKNGQDAKWLKGQLERLPYIAQGNIRFYGQSAEQAGLAGLKLSDITKGGKYWAGFKFYEGPLGARRALRQYLREAFKAGGGKE